MSEEDIIEPASHSLVRAFAFKKRRSPAVRRRKSTKFLSQQDILFPLFSRKAEGDEARSWLFPFYFHRSKPDSSLTLGSLALLPPYLVNQKNAERELFHLWPFYGHTQRGSYSVFEFNPFYYTEQEEGKGSYWSVLGGLFGVETTEEQKKNYRFFWIF